MVTETNDRRRRSLIIPREHGAWGILLVPLLTGAAVGLVSGGEILPLWPFVAAALALFWLRTPVESWLGTGPIRARSGAELQLVRRTVLALAIASALALTWLFWGGRNLALLWIGAGAAVAFGAQAILKKAGRNTRVAAEMVGAAGLTATAPAAYLVTTGQFTIAAWSLWIANLLFAVNQIHFVQVRIRAARALNPKEKLSIGGRFLAGQLILMALVAFSCEFDLFSWYAALAFVPVLLRGFAWFVKPSKPLAIRALGFAELSHAALFGVLFIAASALFPL
jgi:YwiC-like protein